MVEVATQSSSSTINLNGSCSRLDMSRPSPSSSALSVGSATAQEKIKKLSKLEENTLCADCSAVDPDWASVNLGLFLCIVCSGVHRSLGVQVSRIKSVSLDDWKEGEIAAFQNTNNLKENENKWEKSLPKGFVKPTFGDSIGLKEQWIIAKYLNKSFLPLESRDESIKRIDFDIKETWIHKKGARIHSWKKRWLRLVCQENEAQLYYYKNPTDFKPKGIIKLKDIGQVDGVHEVDHKPNCFIISTPNRRYLVSCQLGSDMFRWVQLIRQTVNSINK